VRRWTTSGMLGVVSVAACLAAVGCTQPKVTRVGSVVGIRPEKIDEYKELHANTWPEIRQMIEACNIRNYSIYLGETEPGTWYLFSYFEYVGDDMAADFAKMAADPKTQEWWSHCEPCQLPVPTRQKDEKIWHTMEEVFHQD